MAEERDYLKNYLITSSSKRIFEKILNEIQFSSSQPFLEMRENPDTIINNQNIFRLIWKKFTCRETACEETEIH